MFGKRERRINRILIVEDEALVAFDNERLLQDAGYEIVATVDSLAAAQASLKSAEPDLVLTDIKLGDVGDGVDVARAARALGVNVLFATAHPPADGQSLALGCLAKPYSGAVLRKALDAIDAHLRGEEVRDAPPQLTLYGTGQG